MKSAQGAITVTVPHKNSKIGIFLAICWLYACIHLDRQILGVLAESVKSDLHLDDQQLGVLTGSAFSCLLLLVAAAALLQLGGLLTHGAPDAAGSAPENH